MVPKCPAGQAEFTQQRLIEAYREWAALMRSPDVVDGQDIADAWAEVGRLERALNPSEGSGIAEPAGRPSAAPPAAGGQDGAPTEPQRVTLDWEWSGSVLYGVFGRTRVVEMWIDPRTDRLYWKAIWPPHGTVVEAMKATGSVPSVLGPGAAAAEAEAWLYEVGAR